MRGQTPEWAAALIRAQTRGFESGFGKGREIERKRILAEVARCAVLEGNQWIQGPNEVLEKIAGLK